MIFSMRVQKTFILSTNIPTGIDKILNTETKQLMLIIIITTINLLHLFITIYLKFL